MEIEFFFSVRFLMDVMYIRKKKSHNHLIDFLIIFIQFVLLRAGAYRYLYKMTFITILIVIRAMNYIKG